MLIQNPGMGGSELIEEGLLIILGEEFIVELLGVGIEPYLKNTCSQVKKKEAIYLWGIEGKKGWGGIPGWSAQQKESKRS